jgi:hypothetical protein
LNLPPAGHFLRSEVRGMAERVEAEAVRIDAGLAVEFALLYVGPPLAMALAMPADWLWPVLFGATAVAAGLLARTPGFRWRDLGRGGFLQAVLLHAVCGGIVFTSGLGTFFYHGAVP